MKLNVVWFLYVIFCVWSNIGIVLVSFRGIFWRIYRNVRMVIFFLFFLRFVWWVFMFFLLVVFFFILFVVEWKFLWLLFCLSFFLFVEELMFFLVVLVDWDLVIIFEVFYVVGLVIFFIELFLFVFRNYYMYKRNFEVLVIKCGEFIDEDEIKCVINGECDKWKGICCILDYYCV